MEFCYRVFAYWRGEEVPMVYGPMMAAFAYDLKRRIEQSGDYRVVIRNAFGAALN